VAERVNTTDCDMRYVESFGSSSHGFSSSATRQ